MFNEAIKAFASYLAFALPFITAPLIAWLTEGKFYLVNTKTHKVVKHHHDHELTCFV